MSSLSLVQSCLWTVTRWVPLVQQKLLTFITAHEFTQPCSILSLNSDTMCAPSAAETSYLYHSTCSSLSLVQSCLWTVTRCVPLVQQKLLTFITAHEFTQPCSILSLNSDTMGAPSAAETSYLTFHQHMSSLSLVQSCLWTVTRCVPLVQQKLLTFITAHEFSSLSLVQSCLWTVTRWVPLVQQKLLPLSEHMSSLSLVKYCLWTVTRCVPLGQQTLLTFITAHEFTQTCSILSLNSDTMGAPNAAETSYLYQSTWVHSALFNLVFEQWHDVCS